MNNLTSDKSQYLLDLPKKVEIDGILMDFLTIDQAFPFSFKHTLASVHDNEFTFLYEVNQSKKNYLKFTLYLMEEGTRIGLLRVDYHGQHANPAVITENVPERFHAFAGKYFSFNDHHIHYYVEGYKTTLDWALPLSDDAFPVKEVKGADDLLKAFYGFNSLINLKTKYTIHPILL